MTVFPSWSFRTHVAPIPPLDVVRRAEQGADLLTLSGGSRVHQSNSPAGQHRRDQMGH